jgi:hypothetical protein
MLVNLGGNPDRDDYGLPPVHIEVPDDARDLARDVQAYHRELRAKRRLQFLRRLLGPLSKDGMVLPLLASCLALTLLAGATLTMLDAGRVLQSPVRPTAPVRAPTASVGQAGAALPDTTAQVDGKLTRLRSLAPAVLALVPPGCGCATAVRRLSTQAGAAGVRVYLVGTDHWMTEVRMLAAGSGPRPAHVIDDTADILGPAYHRTGLTAVLVYADGAVSAVVRDLQPGVELAASLQALTSGGPLGPVHPRQTA